MGSFFVLFIPLSTREKQISIRELDDSLFVQLIDYLVYEKPPQFDQGNDIVQLYKAAYM